MKYKPGQKVIVKKDPTWAPHALPIVEKCDHILTIETVDIEEKLYRMEETGEWYYWTDDVIIGLYKKEPVTIIDPIISRFDILDIRE